MQFITTLRLVFIFSFFLLSACGGGGSGDDSNPSSNPPPPVIQNFAFSQVGPFNLLAGDVLTNQATGEGNGVVTYLSSNNTVATVDSNNGLVNIIGAGDAVITANKVADSKYLAATASYTIHAVSVNQTLSFTQSGPIQLLAGDTLTNPATGQGSGAITYISSNPEVATVDSNGLVTVTVIGTGSTIITATKAADPHYYSASTSYRINASGRNQTLSLSQPGPFSVLKGAILNNSATGQGTIPIIYSSSNTNVAVVDSNGQVNVVGAGFVTITASKAADNRYLSATASYSINSQGINFFTAGPTSGFVGGYLSNQATAQGSGSLTYNSSNNNVASVNSDGLVALMGEGHAVITANKTADANYLAASTSYEIHVSRSNQVVSFSQTGPIDLLVGDTITNQATAPGTGSLTYSSSDTNVVTVNSNGVATVVSGGTATITATVAADTRHLSANASYTIHAGVSMTAWVGSNDTLVSFPSIVTGLEFYRSTEAGCNISNFANCNNGQMNVLNGLTIVDSAARLDAVGYYVLQKAQQQAKLTLNSDSSNFPFKNREFPQAVVFNNKLWMIGGYDRSIPEYKNDIWSSIDGISWKEEVTHAPFTAPEYPDLLVFNNRLWLFSGSMFNSKREAWSSSDGINWVKEASNFDSPLFFDNKLATFNNKIWLVGVYRQGGLESQNEVWSTANGKEWTFATNAAFPARGYATLSVFNNQLWLIGGFNNNVIYNDIWSSSDGINWVQRTANANFPARWKHAAIVYNNKLWIIGGLDDNGARNDIWSSSDGITWTQETIHAAFSPRYHHQVVAFDNKLLLIGGYDGEYKNDIWSSTDGIEWRKGFSGTFQFPQ